MKPFPHLHSATLFIAAMLAGLGAASPVYCDTATGALAASIRLNEQRIDRNGEIMPLLFGDIPQDVDINSVIRIKIDRDALNRHVTAPVATAQAQAETDKLRPILEAAEALLRSAATSVDIANEAAIRAIEAEALGRNADGQLLELGGRSEATLGKFATDLFAYIKALESAPDFEIRAHGSLLEKRFNTVAEDIAAGSQAYTADGGARQGTMAYNVYIANLSASVVLEFLNDELQWLQTRQRQAIAVIREELATVALALVARSPSQDGSMQRLHVEYYDELPPGEIVHLDKINWTEDSRAMQEMLEATRPVVAAMEDLRTRRIDAAEAIERILNANGVDVQGLVRAVDDLATSAATLRETDWQLELERLRAEVESMSASRPADTQQLRTAWKELRDTVTAAENAIRLLETRNRLQALKELAKRDLGNGDPVDTLTAFLGRIDNISTSVRGWIGDLEALKSPLTSTASKLRDFMTAYNNFVTTVGRTSGTQRERLESSLKRWSSTLFADVKDRAETVKRETERLVEALKRLKSNNDHRQRLATQLRLYANLDLPVPDDVLYVTGDKLKDTFVDLRTLRQRQDGSVVILDAYLYRLERSGADGSGEVKVGSKMDQGRQQFVLKRYGWYSKPNVGVAYVSSQDKLEGQDKRTTQFTAQASWLFRYRTWAETDPVAMASKPLLAPKPWYSDIGVGPHLVAVDLDKDNQQEIGLGVTLSFFEDFLQLGYGWSVTLDQEPYYFVGLKLLQFGASMGVDTQSSSAMFGNGSE